MLKPTLNREKGQSLVELALTLTILLVMVGGVLELGTILYTSLALRDSAQEGVLYAATNPIDSAGVTNRIQSSASFPINANQISTVNVWCSSTGAAVACIDSNYHSCQGQPIFVQIVYDYHPVSPLLRLPTIPITMSAQSLILRSDAREAYLRNHPADPKCP